MDRFKTAGFFRRYFAQVLDTFINMSVSIVPFFVLVFSAVATYIKSPMELNPLSLVLPIVLLFLMPIVIFFYSWYFTHKFGGTVGKLLFGLRIVDENGVYIDKATAFWRITVGYTISSGFLGLGYLWAFRKKEDLTWHDRFFGTKVLTVGKPIWGIAALVLFKILFIVLLVNFLTGVLPQFLSIPSIVPAPSLDYTQPVL